MRVPAPETGNEGSRIAIDRGVEPEVAMYRPECPRRQGRSTRTLILISLVVIICTPTSALASASSIVAATPKWVFIPRPTTETLATSESETTPAAPISCAVALAA